MRRWPVLLCLVVAASILAVALRPESRLGSVPIERKPPVESPIQADHRVELLQAEVAALRTELERSQAGQSGEEDQYRLRQIVRQAREEWRRSEWEHHLDVALDLEMPRIAERLSLTGDQATRVRAILRDASAPVVDAVLNLSSPLEIERLVDPAQRWDDAVDRRLAEILTPAQQAEWQLYKRELAAH